MQSVQPFAAHDEQVETSLLRSASRARWTRIAPLFGGLPDFSAKSFRESPSTSMPRRASAFSGFRSAAIRPTHGRLPAPAPRPHLPLLLRRAGRHRASLGGGPPMVVDEGVAQGTWYTHATAGVLAQAASLVTARAKAS